jgi:hypothetical protein
MYLVKYLDQIQSFLLTNFYLYFGTEEIYIINLLLSYKFDFIVNFETTEKGYIKQVMKN